MKNTISSDILPQIHPLNTDTIWRTGNYSAFYQSISGNFLDIAVRFWDNHGELVAHIGTAVHQIIRGEEHDIVMSAVLHFDGRITNVGYNANIIQGFIPLDTLYLLLNPTCSSTWIHIDKSTAIQNQRHVPRDISRDSLAASLGMRPLPPLEETRRFDQLRTYMDRLQGVYTTISHR